MYYPTEYLSAHFMTYNFATPPAQPSVMDGTLESSYTQNKQTYNTYKHVRTHTADIRPVSTARPSRRPQLTCMDVRMADTS